MEEHLSNTAAPSNLHSGPIHLEFVKFVDVEPGGELVPYYHLKIVDEQGRDVGHINLKVGNTRHITLCVGHVGFAIHPEFRGHHYAYHACQALRPFILRFFQEVILTADPDNLSSLKTIEKLGARFLEEIAVPPDDPSFMSGSHLKKRYEWVL